jgi:hypothetical protein
MSDTPAITSKNLPPVPVKGATSAPPTGLPPKPPPIVVEIPYDQIEAKPLRSPNFINLYPTNPNLSLFWGNRAVGEKESGLRYDQLIAMGFIPASPPDVFSRNPYTGQKNPCPPSIVRDGRIMYGDLILLKIPRVDYVGSQKWNEQTARLRVKKPGVTMETGASKDIRSASELRSDTDDSRKTTAPAGFPKKVSTYVPQIAETDAKTADNSGPEGDFNLASK